MENRDSGINRIAENHKKLFLRFSKKNSRRIEEILCFSEKNQGESRRFEEDFAFRGDSRRFEEVWEP